MKRIFHTTLAVTALLIAGTASASAHTVLLSSNPAKGAAISHLPARVTLTFADPLLKIGSHAINKVVVTDPMSMVMTTGIDTVKGGVLTDPLTTSSATPGLYTVVYRVSALDGHIVTGKFTFTLK